MQNNPQRVAWTVLWLAFLTFCILATGIPLGVRSYLLSAAQVQETRLQRIAGTIQLRRADSTQPNAVTEMASVAPGDEIVLDATSRGTLDLFERSHVTLYSNTNVELIHVEAPRFQISDRANRITIRLTGGLVRVGVALPGERETQFQVLTPHTTLRLEEGSYRIEVTNQATQITVIRGQALVGDPSDPRALGQGTRTRVELAQQVAEPLPAAENLIENGDFQQSLSSGWVTSTVTLSASANPPAAEVVEDGGRRAVRLVQRRSNPGDHTEVAIHDKIERDVRDFDRLDVSLDVKLEFQSLSGGGLLSSEFPIIVRLDYKDLWGTDKFWTHGFYYQNNANYPIAPDPWGRPTGEQIPQGVWYPYESGNLLDLLGENQPAYITGLTVYASGWNYEGFVSEIQLVVE